MNELKDALMAIAGSVPKPQMTESEMIISTFGQLLTAVEGMNKIMRQQHEAIGLLAETVSKLNERLTGLEHYTHAL